MKECGTRHSCRGTTCKTDHPRVLLSGRSFTFVFALAQLEPKRLNDTCFKSECPTPEKSPVKLEKVDKFWENKSSKGTIKSRLGVPSQAVLGYTPGGMAVYHGASDINWFLLSFSWFWLDSSWFKCSVDLLFACFPLSFVF